MLQLSRLPKAPSALYSWPPWDCPMHWWRHACGDHSPMQPGTETPFWDTSKCERGSLIFCVSVQSIPCVVSSSKYLIVNDKYSRWDRRNQEKREKGGVYQACMLGLRECLWSCSWKSVLDVHSCKVSNGWKRGGLVGGPAAWGQLNFHRLVLLSLVPKWKVLPVKLPWFLDERRHLLHRLASFWIWPSSPQTSATPLSCLGSLVYPVDPWNDNLCSKDMGSYPSLISFTFHYLAFVSHDSLPYLSVVVIWQFTFLHLYHHCIYCFPAGVLS